MNLISIIKFCIAMLVLLAGLFYVKEVNKKIAYLSSEVSALKSDQQYLRTVLLAADRESMERDLRGFEDRITADLEAYANHVREMRDMYRAKFLNFVVSDVQYLLTKRQFVPFIEIDGMVSAIECPCPRRILVKFNLQVLSDNEKVGEKDFEVVLINGQGKLNVDLLLSQLGLNKDKIELKWTVMAWQLSNIGGLRAVEFGPD